jgi:hypothetical protein
MTIDSEGEGPPAEKADHRLIDCLAFVRGIPI